MRGQDIVAIVGTFMLGLFCGWYLFVFGFSLQFDDVTDIATGESLVVIGEAYGGCERGGGCASYRIAEDGTYRAFSSSVDVSSGRVVKEGEVPADWYRDIKDTLTESELTHLSEPYQKTDCKTYNDGIEYRYRVQLGEAMYELDTCTTALAKDADARALLQDLFLYMEL